jgi:hypothetical protein
MGRVALQRQGVRLPPGPIRGGLRFYEFISTHQVVKDRLVAASTERDDDPITQRLGGIKIYVLSLHRDADERRSGLCLCPHEDLGLSDLVIVHESVV